MYFKHILQVFSIYTFELGIVVPTFLHATPTLYRENQHRTYNTHQTSTSNYIHVVH